MNKRPAKNIVITVIIGAISLLSVYLWEASLFQLKDPEQMSTYRFVANPNPPMIEEYTPKPPVNEGPATTTQSGKIDEHLTIDNTLRDVNFCGTIYRSKQVFIDGVDVVQRIAEIITKSRIIYESEVCKLATDIIIRINDPFNSNLIGISEVTSSTSDGYKLYRIELVSPTKNMQHVGDFQINASTKDISILISGFADVSENFIGKLK